MSPLNDSQISDYGQTMIWPFVPGQVRQEDGRPVISYGLSSFGYDIRIRDKFKMLSSVRGLIDPKQIGHSEIETTEIIAKNGYVDIIPHGFLLGESVEHITMPDDMLAVCLGKSTYARCGLIVNVTPLEPGWRGTITIEISNTTDLYARVYANEGIAQLIFFRGNRPKTSYADRNGKYMDQKGIVPARV